VPALRSARRVPAATPLLHSEISIHLNVRRWRLFPDNANHEYGGCQAHS
jgi:hypothetical protein